MEDKAAIVSSTYIVFKVKKLKNYSLNIYYYGLKETNLIGTQDTTHGEALGKLFHGIIYVKLNYQFLVLIFKNQL